MAKAFDSINKRIKRTKERPAPPKEKVVEKEIEEVEIKETPQKTSSKIVIKKIVEEPKKVELPPVNQPAPQIKKPKEVIEKPAKIKKPKKEGVSWKQAFKGVSFSTRLSIAQQSFFVKRLAFLIRAGVPLIEGLTMIREQTYSKGYNKVLDSLIHDVSQGQSLSTAMAKFEKMFGDFAINIIAVGESSGTLTENLEYLADELKKKQTLRRKVAGAFVYPAVVTFATLGITTFLMVYLFPKITPVFASLHIALPLSTRIVMAMSNILIGYGYYILGVLILLVIAFLVMLKKSPTFHFYVDRYLLKIPIIGKIIQYYNLAGFTRTMGLLLKGGIPLSETLPITARTTKNLVYRDEFAALAAVVNRGEKMSVYLKGKRKLFPDILAQITSVGERSGSLSNSLVYLSDMYEGDMDDFTKNLSNLIEPVLMIFMGLMVGFIAISIITPIYSITQNLHP